MGYFTKWLAVLPGALLLGAAVSGHAAETKTASCDPIGQFRFLCGLGNPEDLMAVPGTRWMVTSGLKRGEVKGGLYLVDTTAKTWKPYAAITPSAVTNSKFSCPALPDPEQFYAHGLALRQGQNNQHTLYVINHEKLERIEIYAIDASGNGEPKLTWTDCIVFDTPKTRPNSLAVLPGGGLVVSSFGNPAVKINEKGGGIYEWFPDKGIYKLEGTDMVGPNGIEASPDGKFIYVNGWGEQKFVRITRGTSPLKIEEFPVDFQPDNLHWGPDGMLLSAGTNGSARFGYCSPKGCEGFVVAKVDPVTMQHRVIMRYIGDDAAPLAHASVAYQIGDTYWLGTLDGDRIAYVPASAVE